MKKLTEQKKGEIIKAVKLIDSLKASILIITRVGFMDINNPKDFIDFLEDEDRFTANQVGVDIDTYKAWKSYDGQCTGKTKTGKRCKNTGGFWFHANPNEFTPGTSDRCAVHKGIIYD